MAAAVSPELESLVKLPLTRLSLSVSPEKFKTWDLRFTAHVLQCKPELGPFLEPDADVAVLTEKSPKNMRLFSSLLIPCVGDDVLERFSIQLDLKVQGLACYQRLVQQFAQKKSVQLSPDEQLLLCLKKSFKYSDASSLECFLREAQDTLNVVQRADNQSPMAERLLIHHVLQQITAVAALPWASTVCSQFMDHLRSDAVRRDSAVKVPKEFSLQALVDIVRGHLTVLVSGKLVCSFCERIGHEAAQCWDRKGYEARFQVDGVPFNPSNILRRKGKKGDASD